MYIFKGELSSEKVVFFVFLYDSRLGMVNFKKTNIQVNCLNRSKVIKLFVFQLWRHTGTPRKCTGLCSLSDKEGILENKRSWRCKINMVDTLWDNQMIFEDFRRFHRICDVTGGKKGKKVPKWSKTPYLDSSMS